MAENEYDFASIGSKAEFREMAERITPYSGHVLFCPGCKEFRRTKISLQAEDGTPLLKVECKVCGAADYFLVRPDGSTIHAQFAALLRRYAKRRAIEILVKRHQEEMDAR